MLTDRFWLSVFVFFMMMLGIFPADSYTQTIPTRTPTPGRPIVPTRTPTPTRTPMTQHVTRLGSVDAGEDVFVKNKIAYSIGEYNSFKTTDLSDPANPAVLDTIRLGAFTKKMVHVAGDTAYLVQGNGRLAIIDVADPTNLVLLNRYEVFSYYDVFNHTDSGNMYINADSTYIVHDVAYFTVYNKNRLTAYSYLYAVDVSDPTAPYILDSYILDFQDMATSGVSGNNISNLFIEGDRAYIFHNVDGLVVLDISDPAHITHETSYDGLYLGEITISDGIMYHLNRYFDNYIRVFDADEGSQLTIHDRDELSNPTDIYVENDIAYVTDSDNGLFLFDVSDPITMTLLSFHDGIHGDKLFVEDGLIYVAERQNDESRLHILEYTPSDLTHVTVASETTRQPVYSLAVILAAALILTTSLTLRAKRAAVVGRDADVASVIV